MFFLPPNGKKLTLKGMAFNLKGLSEKLAAQRRIAEENDAKRRAEKLGLPYLDLVSVRVPTEIDAMKLVPEERARQALIVPLQLIGKKLTIAAFNPSAETAREIIDALKKTHEVSVVISSLTGIKHGWNYYQYVPKETKEITGKVEIDDKRILELAHRVASLEDAGKELATFKNPLVSQVLEVILGSALALRASDVHLEPLDSALRVRFRVDGILEEMMQIPASLNLRVVSHIRVTCGLDPERGIGTSKPEDARMSLSQEGIEVDLRLSTFPTPNGDKAVLRLIPRNTKVPALEEIGLEPKITEALRAVSTRPQGMFIVTGPTGSGKSTTLYTLLQQINSPSRNIVTLEDPIEKKIPGVNQGMIQPKAGFGFAEGLRAILRQDPNVIMVGEIRDLETAEIAVSASLTGHMIFTTLHTNSALGAITRLFDMGLEPFLIASALTAVSAQRLARKVCETCAQPYEPTAAEVAEVEHRVKSAGIRMPDSLLKSLKRGAGCGACRSSGYLGRTLLFEYVAISPALRALILKKAGLDDLRAAALKDGNDPLIADGLRKAAAGVISISEVFRVVDSTD